MLLEPCGCGFDPGRFHGDPPKFVQPCIEHKDIPVLIPLQSWVNLVAKTPKVKAPVVESPTLKAKQTVSEKISIDGKPV